MDVSKEDAAHLIAMRSQNLMQFGAVANEHALIDPIATERDWGIMQKHRNRFLGRRQNFRETVQLLSRNLSLRIEFERAACIDNDDAFPLQHKVISPSVGLGRQPFTRRVPNAIADRFSMVVIADHPIDRLGKSAKPLYPYPSARIV